MDIPVYLFMGFLDSGKTTYIRTLISRPNFTQGKRFLLLTCEEGEEEYDEDLLKQLKIEIRSITSPDELTLDHLKTLVKETRAQRVAIEYNAMWTLAPLAQSMPDNWYVFQSVSLFDSENFMVYNNNMRSLVYEMLSSSSMVLFNRLKPEEDTSPFHKAVRQVNRQTEIFYRTNDGKITKDEIVDPLPFDVNAPVIDISDRDFALWFSDMYESPEKYHQKTVRFLAWGEVDEDCPPNLFMAGRHVLACCANDIQYAWLPAFFDRVGDYRFPAWCRITGVLDTQDERNGGVSLKVQNIEPAKEPAEPVVSLY